MQNRPSINTFDTTLLMRRAHDSSLMPWLAAGLAILAIVWMIGHGLSRPDTLEQRFAAVQKDVAASMKKIRDAKSPRATGAAIATLLEAGRAADRIATEAAAKDKECLAAAAGFTADWISGYRSPLLQERDPHAITEHLQAMQVSLSGLLACNKASAD
jgi:hypothetical protein